MATAYTTAFLNDEPLEHSLRPDTLVSSSRVIWLVIAFVKDGTPNRARVIQEIDRLSHE